jgi:hypothetical protein
MTDSVLPAIRERLAKPIGDGFGLWVHGWRRAPTHWDEIGVGGQLVTTHTVSSCLIDRLYLD